MALCRHTQDRGSVLPVPIKVQQKPPDRLGLVLVVVMGEGGRVLLRVRVRVRVPAAGLAAGGLTLLPAMQIQV